MEMQGFVFTQKYVIPEVFYRESIERNGSPTRDLGDDANYFFMQIEVAWVYTFYRIRFCRSFIYTPNFDKF